MFIVIKNRLQHTVRKSLCPGRNIPNRLGELLFTSLHLARFGPKNGLKRGIPIAERGNFRDYKQPLYFYTFIVNLKACRWSMDA